MVVNAFPFVCHAMFHVLARDVRCASWRVGSIIIVQSPWSYAPLRRRLSRIFDFLWDVTALVRSGLCFLTAPSSAHRTFSDQQLGQGERGEREKTICLSGTECWPLPTCWASCAMSARHASVVACADRISLAGAVQECEMECAVATSEPASGRGHSLAQARLAQSAERKALNLVVVGSSPTVGVGATLIMRW